MSKDSLYFPAMDTLRAIAVVEVIAYHCRLSPFRAGWLGVSFFFVISGFLITFMLLREHSANGAVNLRRFFARRARRLLPGLTAFVVVYALVALWYGRGLERVSTEVATAILHISNWTRIYLSQPKDLGHLWSLAIEVQFYALWGPLCAFMLRRSRSVVPLMVLCAVLIIAGERWRDLLIDMGTSRVHIYNGFFSRVDGFAAGALLACIVARWPRVAHATEWRFTVPISLLSLAALYYHWQLVHRVKLETAWLVSGSPTIFALTSVLVLWGSVVSISNFGERLFVPLRYLGKISYGLYLWHYPLLQVKWIRAMPGREKFALVCGVALVCAILSYELIERRFIRERSKGEKDVVG